MCQLEKAISIVKELKKRGHKAYFCGGCVRDYLLKRKPKDYDIVTDAHIEDIKRIFNHTIAIGAKFGIIKVLSGKESFEVATFRKDGEYQDGRRPVSVAFCDEKEDAMRRDFTVNGLFLEPDSYTIIDYVGGQKDIENKLIRTIGNPHSRFSEDHLRLMRAVRFAAQLSFEIVEETWEALVSMSKLIQTVSPERIRDELTNMLLCSHPDKAILNLKESKLLYSILPEMEGYQDNFSLTTEMLALASPLPGLDLGLGILLFPFLCFPAQGRCGEKKLVSVTKRLCLSRKTSDYLASILKNYHSFQQVPDMSKASLKRFFAIPEFPDLLELHRLEQTACKKNLDIFFYCQSKFKEWGMENVKPVPLVHGEDLMNLGFMPGPLFKKILYFIEEQQLEGSISTRKDAINLIKSHFGEGENIETKKI